MGTQQLMAQCRYQEPAELQGNNIHCSAAAAFLLLLLTSVRSNT